MGRGTVRLEVDRLEHTSSDAGVRVLRATGRAWSRRPARLGVAVLVAGTARVAPDPGARPVLAGPDGPYWVAEFRVPEPVAVAARAWAIETDVPHEAADGDLDAARRSDGAGDGGDAGERGDGGVPVEADRAALERRLADLSLLLGRARAADGPRPAAADTSRAEPGTPPRAAAQPASAADREAELADLRRALDAARAERDQAREHAAETAAALGRSEEQRRAEAHELREALGVARAGAGDAPVRLGASRRRGR